MQSYKSNIIHDNSKTLGYPFALYYDAKPKVGCVRIGMAVSNDMLNWVIKHNGVVYHYYCAVGDQGRVIALATSKDLSSSKE